MEVIFSPIKIIEGANKNWAHFHKIGRFKNQTFSNKFKKKVFSYSNILHRKKIRKILLISNWNRILWSLRRSSILVSTSANHLLVWYFFNHALVKLTWGFFTVGRILLKFFNDLAVIFKNVSTLLFTLHYLFWSTSPAHCS